MNSDEFIRAVAAFSALWGADANGNERALCIEPWIADTHLRVECCGFDLLLRPDGTYQIATHSTEDGEGLI